MNMSPPVLQQALPPITDSSSQQRPREAPLRGSRGHVSRDVEHIVDAERIDDPLHERRPEPLSDPLLHVEELTHRVARRPASDTGQRTQALKVRSMTERALTAGHQRLALGNAPL